MSWFAFPLVQALLKIAVIVLGFVMLLGTLLTLMERKWMSAVQDRVGPNRANLGRFTFHGALHIVADGLKSIFKEDTVPANANRLLFFLAPFFAFFSVIVIWAVIPFAAPWGDFQFQIADLNIGVLLVLAVSSLGVYGAVLAGWSSNNKFALLGATRASAQMISYEVFLGLSLVGLLMVYGSVQVSTLAAAQGEYWFGDLIPKWGLFVQPLGFLLFFIAMLAELKRQPFDAPEGESEIIAGYFLEYSGMRWSAFVLSEYVGVVGLGGLTTTLFLGSYHFPWLHADGFRFAGGLLPLFPLLVTALQIFAFVLKTVLLCWLVILIRWTLPRFRFDQTMALGWKFLLPVALANVVITALVLLIWDL